MSANARTPGDARSPDRTTVYAQPDTEGLPDKPTDRLRASARDLDQDLAAELDRRRLSRGAFLELGTGPGTQARQLARRGFKVTGSNSCATAIGRARAKGAGDVIFVEDDILRTRLVGPFDVVFDRACLHFIEPEDRSLYVANVHKLLKTGGLLLLKCASEEQPDADPGPRTLTPADLRTLFGDAFTIESIRDTVYQGSGSPPAKALFAALTPKPLVPQ